MFNREKMQITFPHIVLSNKLDGKEYTWNDVDGGIKRIADFGLIRNSFFGGQVTIMGLIKTLGLWACQHYESKRIVGFYVDDANRLTDKGKELIRRRFSDCEIIFDKEVEVVAKMTVEEAKRRNELKEELIKYGVEPAMVSHTNANELAGLLKAVISGKADKPTVQVETVVVEEPVKKATVKRM